MNTECIHINPAGLIVNHLHGDTLPAGHRYFVGMSQNDGNDRLCVIDFQRGPVPSNGINGLTNEALLAVLIHRTTILDGLYPCKENAQAIAHMSLALAAFESRTAKRIARGVEGTMTA